LAVAGAAVAAVAAVAVVAAVAAVAVVAAVAGRFEEEEAAAFAVAELDPPSHFEEVFTDR